MDSLEAAANLLLRIWRTQGLKYSKKYGLGVVVEDRCAVEPAHEGRAADYLTIVRWLQQSWQLYPEIDLTKLLNARTRQAYLHVRRELNQGDVGYAQALDGQSAGLRSIASDVGLPRWPLFGPGSYLPPDLSCLIDVRAAVRVERKHPAHDPRDLSAVCLRIVFRWSWEAITLHPACRGLTPEGLRKRVARLLRRLAHRLRDYRPVAPQHRGPARGSHRHRFACVAQAERAIIEGSYVQLRDGGYSTRLHADIAHRTFTEPGPCRLTYYSRSGDILLEDIWDRQDPGEPVEVYPDDPDDEAAWDIWDDPRMIPPDDVDEAEFE